MIHQMIFAAPKPGMTEQEFCDYWLDVHAVKFASKIPQIRKYKIDTRVPFGDGDGPPWKGVAEIWLENAEEELASLQTPEFLEGARADEPNWAAFWLSIVIDTTAHEVLSGDVRPDGVKLTTLLKRRPGLPLADYRDASLTAYAPVANGLPGLRRHLHCHTRDGAYVFGESSFDSVEQWWFDDLAALRDALGSPYYAERITPARAAIVDPRYVFSLTAQEHWII